MSAGRRHGGEAGFLTSTRNAAGLRASPEGAGAGATASQPGPASPPAPTFPWGRGQEATQGPCHQEGSPGGAGWQDEGHRGDANPLPPRHLPSPSPLSPAPSPTPHTVPRPRDPSCRLRAGCHMARGSRRPPRMSPGPGPPRCHPATSVHLPRAPPGARSPPGSRGSARPGSPSLPPSLLSSRFLSSALPYGSS